MAATSRDLPRLLEEDSFRIDLYYRLNVFAIEAPPLRDRMEDIPLLCGTLSENMPSVRKSGSKLFSQKIWGALVHYQWPGNVRKLQNIIERCVVLSVGTVLHQPPLAWLKRVGRNAPPEVRTLAEAEREHILQTLREANWVIGGRLLLTRVARACISCSVRLAKRGVFRTIIFMFSVITALRPLLVLR